MINLSFVETFRYTYPVPSQNVYPPTLSPTGITVGAPLGDPVLIFLTQTTFADELVWLHLSSDIEMNRMPTPPGADTISGLGYNLVRNRLIAGLTTPDEGKVLIMDADTGAIVAERDLSASTVFSPSTPPQAMSSNGTVIVQAGHTTNILGSGGASVGQSTIQMWAYDGTPVAQKTYDERKITGISHTRIGWVYTDVQRDEIVVLGPLGNEIAVAPGVGAATGMQAIAFDNIRDQSAIAQNPVPGGGIGAVGTPQHPDTPWDPQPWLGRHRLYIANTADQTIYAGYLTKE